MATTEIHRTAKLFFDTEKAKTEAEALSILGALSLTVMMGTDSLMSHNHQVALLTLVNAGARTFLGGVNVCGKLADTRVLPNVPCCRSLAKTIEFYGGSIVDSPVPDSIIILLGDVEEISDFDGIQLRLSWERWCAFVGPSDLVTRRSEDSEFPPSAIYAASVALSEAFQHAVQLNPQACRRLWQFSLYRPDYAQEPLAMPGSEDPVYLPSNTWIVGLGHLGQAYLWSFLCLRYPVDQMPQFVLQDVDVVSEATLSTGMLAFRDLLGERKTRAVGGILESVGCKVRLVERRFDGIRKHQDDEPQRMLSGLDNPEDRAKLEDADFVEIIDAGLGAAGEQFLSYQIRVFPSTSRAKSVFGSATTSDVSHLLEKAAYKALVEATGKCGVLEIASKAVGAPFVGCAVAAMVAAEAIRSTMNGPRYEGLSGSLRTQEGAQAVWKGLSNPGQNLGFTASP